jgi:hypothetical protein
MPQAARRSPRTRSWTWAASTILIASGDERAGLQALPGPALGVRGASWPAMGPRRLQGGRRSVPRLQPGRRAGRAASTTARLQNRCRPEAWAASLTLTVPDQREGVVPQTLSEYRSVPLKPGFGVYRNRSGLSSSVPLAGRDAIDADVSSSRLTDGKVCTQRAPLVMKAVIETVSLSGGWNLKGLTSQRAQAGDESADAATI